MSHWQLLGLDTGADERAIKRAYARLLKVHRPDEDADAFQQLREAYEAALEETRWREQWEAEEDDYEVVTDTSVAAAVAQDSQLAATFAPVEAAAPEPLQVAQADFTEYLTEVAEPDVSLEQVYQWFAEAEEDQLLQAFPGLLASEWLQSFDRRQWFEEQVLRCFETYQNWSADFFDQIAALMGWDDAQGHLPCDNGRWRHLLELRAAAAEVDKIRYHLERPEPSALPSFLFKPQSDTARRRLADGFDANDWDQCKQLAWSFEQRDPEQLERVGIVVADDWRNWLPRSSVAFAIYFWLLTCCLTALAHVPSANGWIAKDVIHVVLSAAVATGGTLWVYVIWRRVAMTLAVLDVPLSRMLLPARLYRHGAGVLVFRHVLPCAVAAAVAHWNLRGLEWIGWVVPAAFLLLLLYLVDATLRGTIPAPWSRAWQVMTRPTEEAGW